jgi:hypothetical protein
VGKDLREDMGQRPKGDRGEDLKEDRGQRPKGDRGEGLREIEGKTVGKKWAKRP